MYSFKTSVELNCMKTWLNIYVKSASAMAHMIGFEYHACNFNLNPASKYTSAKPPKNLRRRTRQVELHSSALKYK